MGDVWEGTDMEFARRLQALIAASGGQVGVVSAYRSNERQAQLYAEGQRKYGADVNRWVAPPGRSNHNRGLAVDLWYASDEAKEWVHRNAARYGLAFPMNHEPWHIEPVGVRDGSYKSAARDPDAYTLPPDGQVPIGALEPEAEKRTLEDQARTLMAFLVSPSTGPVEPTDSGMLGSTPPGSDINLGEVLSRPFQPNQDATIGNKV
jgi:hypothetical protein